MAVNINKQFNPVHALSVSQVPLEDYDKVRKIATRWQSLAQKYNKDKEYNEKMIDSQEICGRLATGITEEMRVDVCYLGNIQQAIIATFEEKDHIQIDLLASCPWNISPIEGIENFPVKGSATVLMWQVFQRALSQEKDVEVEAYQSSRGFYDRWGFVTKGEEDWPKNPMIIEFKSLCKKYPEYR